METHFHWILLKLLIEACFTIGQQQDNALTLSSSKQAVEENSSVALTCSRDTTEVWASRWSTSQYENKYALCTKKDNMCFKTSFLNDSAVYECICNNNGSYTVLLKKVNRFQHTFKWTCSYLNFNSNTVVINVSVPVETLEIMDTNKGYKAENQKFDFRCKSSFSRPKQDLYWFLNNGTPDFHDDERIISNNTESIVNETIGNKTGNILTSTESTLTLNVQRSMNNQQIYCLTNDTSGRVIRSTMEILNVSCLSQNSPVVLSSLKATVLENSSVALTCSNTTGIMVSSHWNTSLYDNQQAYCYRFENSCQKTSFLKNITLFDCICNDNGSYTVLLKHVDRYQHGSIWRCGNLFEQSNTVVINVSVPVTQAFLTQNSTEPLYENTSVTFTCTSSYSLPSAQIRWYLSNSSSTVEITGSQDVDIKRETQTREDNVIRVVEALAYRVDRSVNGWNVYCTAVNWQNNVVNTENISLSVIYPPCSHPVIDDFLNGSTYTVVENHEANLSCSVTGGNPLAKPRWKCEDNSITSNIRNTNNETVTSYLSWNATRTSGKTCICITGHVLSNVSSYVNIDVLYPPSLPDFYMHITNGSWITVSSKINITENSTLTINCSSESNPVSNFSWTGPKTSNNETLVWDVVNNRTEGSYTCTAINCMTQTNGTPLEGKTNNSILVDVLYPPSDIAFTLRNQTTNIYVTETVNMFENVSYILTCHARGKPGPTYKWTGPLSLKSNILNLTNINRNKTGHYTCEAENTIYESTGVIHNGRENKSIYLNIQYASEVTEFYIDGHREDNTIITNQGENANFICNVDSNPNSSVSLLFKDEYLKNNTNTRNLTHLVENLQCSSAGIYYCFSSNEVNYSKLSWKRFTLIVKCPPLPERNLKFNVTTLKYVPATLSFKAMDFLDSDKTSFTWEKQNNASKWETVKKDTQVVNISTFNLQTNLTVLNVTRHFSGYYRVIYNNSVGGNTQMFQLSVADIPDAPTYFDYLKESLTFTQVTVFWTKGFGGGLRQTFVLNIFQTSQLVKYDYINETENELMKHTITGLSSGTQYDLTLWATNSVGKSLSQTLTILTKEVDVHSSATLTAPIAGSVSSVVAIVAGFFVAFMLCKRRLKQKTDSNNGDRSYANICGMKTKSGGNSTNCEPVYEGVKPIHERGYVEMKEQTYDKIKLADSPEIKDPIYTNLKL